MEVRKGFKQTEIGVFPEDWQVTTISNVADTSSGTTPSRSMLERYYNNGTIYWVKTLDLNNSEIFSTEENVTQEAINETSLKIYPAGTVLVAMYGGFNQIGRTGLLRNPATINQALTAIRPNTKVLSSEYLLRVLNYRVNYWKSIASSSRKDPNITGRDVREFPLAFPKVEEQQAIATVLSDVDALLNSLDALIAKKRLIKQGAMQELLLGKRRLPGFHGEWKWKKVGDVISNCFSGATPSRRRPDFFKGDIRWITSTELNYNVITDTTEKITSEAVKSANMRMLPKNTFLMAITGLEAAGTRGRCGIVGEEATSNQSCMALFPTDELLVEYLFHYYVFAGDRLALQYCQGTKQQSYTAQTVKLLPIYLPPVPEQYAIAEVLSDMDAEITALEQRRQKTCLLKQGMMQELLTGKTRLI